MPGPRTSMDPEPASAVGALDRALAAVGDRWTLLLVAALFRFNGLDWDSNQTLHPDERFLISVTNDRTRFA